MARIFVNGIPHKGEIWLSVAPDTGNISIVDIKGLEPEAIVPTDPAPDEK